MKHGGDWALRRFFLLIVLLLVGVLFGLTAESPVSTGISPPPRGSTDPFLKIDVYYTATGQVSSMDLETYIKGVVASEMPASAGIEALKAQAVAARTVAVRKMRVLGGAPSRPDADVTSDFKIDQAWNPESVIKERWGPIAFWLNWPKIERAVEETRGVILTYQGIPCDIVYHSTCGGRTEAAKDVWGRDVPYLKSVSCSFCQHSPYFKTQTVSVPALTVAQALAKLGVAVPAAAIKADNAIAVSQVSPSGRIKEVVVSNQAVRGLEFRMALGLKSTLLSWTSKGDSLVFQVKGYGHGAGMCQYGADGMARQGRSYTEILDYYYPGTKTVHIFEE